MRLRVVFLPRRRVFLKNVRRRVGDRLKRRPRFSLSLLHVKVQESPSFCYTFHFGPLIFDFVFCPDFGWISFVLVQLGPPIGID